eukprot:13896588-Alexandrium_andersonii.AAC.1
MLHACGSCPNQRSTRFGIVLLFGHYEALAPTSEKLAVVRAAFRALSSIGTHKCATCGVSGVH